MTGGFETSRLVVPVATGPVPTATDQTLHPGSSFISAADRRCGGSG